MSFSSLTISVPCLADYIKWCSFLSALLRREEEMLGGDGFVHYLEHSSDCTGVHLPKCIKLYT